MDNFTLFFANTIVALVLAAAFFVAGKARKEGFWHAWSLANGIIALALLAFMFESRLADLFVLTAPNCLLVLGLSLKWRGSRQFERRKAHTAMLWAPSLLFVSLCMIPWVYGSYGAVYTIVNVLLASLAGATALEFWRGREADARASISRNGLVAVYAIMAVSFAVRVVQGLLTGGEMERQIPDDGLLMIHLALALVHLAGSGAFALCLAYERDAARLRWMASRDPLTGLLNRAAFEERVRGALQSTDGEELALLMIDMDHFKQINDRHGHAAGDEALRRCATVLTAALGEQAVVARWGGEEFAALLAGVSPRQAHLVAQRLRDEIGRTVICLETAQFNISASVGICHTADSPRQFDQLMRQADTALYAAKANGRNRVEIAAA